MSVTDEIKARLDIVDFIGNYVQLKKAGRNYKALCPFHSEKTPSFVIFPESQRWRCFGACGEGGDIFTFAMKIEGWDFSQALQFLAQKAGIELEPFTPQQAKSHEATERLRGLLADATQFFHRQLLQAPNAAHARAYVEKRGLLAGTVALFEIGYAPHSWDAATSYLLERGYQQQELAEAGMLVVKDDGDVYDRFRNRLMIPIRDARGNVVGFGARALASDAEPKYLNSPQSPIFDKSHLLFGLSHARRSIRESETAIIVEGYMDVMQAHQAGFTNVVAQMGTALTEPQLRMLARYASRLVLALDPDTAGQMATDRGREVIERVSRAAAEQVMSEDIWDASRTPTSKEGVAGLDAAEREHRTRLTIGFDAQGMISYESRLGFDIRVMILPSGKDPDDLIRDDPQTWSRLVGQALPITEYVIHRTTEGQNLDDPKVKSRIAGQIIPLIEDIADPVERTHYRQRLARLLKVPESVLFPKGTTSHSAARTQRRAAQPQAAAPDLPKPAIPGLTASSTQSREAFCLAALIRYPRLIYRVNRVLAEYLAPEQLSATLSAESVPGTQLLADGLAWRVVANDFTRPEHRSIFSTWLAALEQEEMEPILYLLQSLDPASSRLAESWLQQPLYALSRDVMPPSVDLPYEKVCTKVIEGILTLRNERLSERWQEVVFLVQEADKGGDRLTLEAYNETLKALSIARQRVERARERYSPSARRVASAGTSLRRQ